MKTIQKGQFLGINNRKPDYALHVDKTGDFLRDALNVDLDNVGTLRRRKAEELAQAMSNAHSLHMTSDTAGYIVIGGVIYAITTHPSYSQTPFKVLSNDNPVSWLTWNGDLYYSNGADSGRINGSDWFPMAMTTPDSPAVASLPGGSMVAGKYQVAVSQYNHLTGEEGGVSASTNYELSLDGGLRVTLPALATGSTRINVYVSTCNGSIPMLHGYSTTGGVAYDITINATGRESNQRYEAPLPAGWLFLFNGCLCSYSGSNVYEGSPFRPGYYLPSEGRIPFTAEVSNCVPAQNGVYIVADKTYWLAGPRMTTTEMIQDVLPYGGVPHTEFSVPNKSLYGWFGQEGFVLGTPSGEAQAVMSDNIKLTPPASGSSIILETEEYRRVVSCGWCMNLDTKAATRYDWTFTSTSGAYGTKSDGLYLMEGTGDVAWSVDFGKENFGSEQKKRLPAIYLGCASERPIKVRVKTPQHDFTYTARSCSDELKEHRVDPGKGLQANWFNLSIEESCDFTLASVSFAPVASNRRI